MYRVSRAAVLYIFLFSLFLLTNISPVHALLNEDEYSSSEKVGFAFNKIAKTTPRYETWVKYSDRYAKTPEAERSMMLQSQTYRLEKGFNIFNLDEDLIKISAVAHVYFTNANGRSMGVERKNGYRPMLIKVNETKNTYFPVHIGNSWVAVIPSDTNLFESINIKDDVYDRFKKYASKENVYKVVRLEIWLRPDSVDNKKPMTLEGKPMWLMMARVANMELWDMDAKNLIWSHSAPWYTSTQAKEMLDLYQNGDSQPYAPSPKK